MGDRLQQGVMSSLGLDSVLQLYRPGMSFFGSPRGAVLAMGQTRGMSVEDLRATLRGHVGSLPVLAAVPFADSGLAKVLEPDLAWLCRDGVVDVDEAIGRDFPLKRAACLRQQCPAPDGYMRNVDLALSAIRSGVLEKVVLSRCLGVEADVDLKAVLCRMLARNPLGYTFAVALGGNEPCTLIGASPELLLSKRGRVVVSNPLAGSIPHAKDPVEDAERARCLLSSEKDLREHAVVVRAVEQALRPHCVSLEVPSRPVLLSTPTMWHLSTEVRGELRNPLACSLDLALSLHPTPAVCGYPEAVARDFILKHEGFDRGLFTGLVGWAGAGGDGDWAVTIRCAEVAEGCVRLYAGAGVVEGSVPELELLETRAKLGTMLDAMGLEAVLGVGDE